MTNCYSKNYRAEADLSPGPVVLALFTGVRGRKILRNSPKRRSEKFHARGNSPAGPGQRCIASSQDAPRSAQVYDGGALRSPARIGRYWAVDIVVLVLALIIGLFVLRLAWALGAVVVVWVVAVWMTGWGPAHSSGVTPGSAGFLVPWLVVLIIALALMYGAHWLRTRRSQRGRVS
jgi:hypothetical protein